MGPLLRASCGYRKPFRGPRSGSRSLQIESEYVRPYICSRLFFLDLILDQENGILVEETRKNVQKSDIALIT